MEERQPSFPIGAQVQLKPSFGEIYLQAWGGSLGFVRDVKWDEYGFEKIFISWDRENDWRYNNMPDSWTYASHFNLKALPPEKTPKPPKQKQELALPPELDHYMEELQKGIEALTGSEGFALFVARRVPVEDSDQAMIVPEVYTISHSDEAGCHYQYSSLPTSL